MRDGTTSETALQFWDLRLSIVWYFLNLYFLRLLWSAVNVSPDSLMVRNEMEHFVLMSIFTPENTVGKKNDPDKDLVQSRIAELEN